MRLRKKQHFHIEIAPVNLIDLVLILLVFFITTTTFLNLKLIEMNFPQAANATPVENVKDKTLINIDPTGAVFLNKEKVDRRDLAKAVKKLPKNTTVLFGVDEAAKYGDFISVIDLLKGAGLSDIAIITREKLEQF